MSDLISRQAAIDAECEVCRIAPKKERGHNCTYYVHGCKEIECLRALPSAQPQYEEITPEEAASEIASGSIMSARYWYDVTIRLKRMGYAICREK